MNLAELTQLIIDTTRAVLEEQEVQADETLSADTRLFGDQGLLDSLALVSLVIAVEQGIEEQFEVSVELADDKALSQKNSPYRSVGTLAAYAMEQFEAKQRIR